MCQTQTLGAEMEPLFESPTLKSGLGCFFRYGTHQTISGRLEQVYLPSDTRLEWPAEAPLFEFDLNECQGPLYQPWDPWPDMALV